MRPAVLILLLILIVAGGFVCSRQPNDKSQDRPIQNAAQRYDVDAALVKAIVWQESRFNPNARGKAGELGLMQLQYVAAIEWADSERIASYDHEHCLDPVTNTLAGTYYLRMLLQRYQHTDDPLPYALADYNAGRANVLKWNSGSAQTNSAQFIEQIGFPSTQEYVTSVMQRSKRY